MGVNILFKNTLNTFKKKKLQFLAIGIMIVLSSFIYTTMFYAMDSLKTPLENFIEESNQEDFSIVMVNGLTESDINNFTDEEQRDSLNMLSYNLSDIKRENEDLYNKIIENRINSFEDEYSDFELENRETKEISFKNNGVSNKITFFKDSEEINLSFIEEGKKPIKDNEIAITKIYAKKNNLVIGDTLSIEDKNYTITGLVLFPDRTFPVDNNEFNIDNGKITLGLVNNDEYERLKGNEDFYLAGVAKDDTALEDFNDEVIKTYSDNDNLDYALNITLTENQVRSGVIYTELVATEAVTVGLSIVISTIVVFIVLMITYRIVKNEKTQIGVIKALGYSNKEILKPYIILLSIISVPLLLIGYILGIYGAPYMSNVFLEFYLIPSGDIKTSLSVLIIAIVVPFVVIVGLSSILIKKMLSKRAINLINSNESGKVSKLTIIGGKLLKRAKPQTKFKYSFILANTNKFIVFFIGISFASMLVIMSFMVSGFFEKMSVDYYNSVDYVYEGIVDMSKELPEVDSDDEKFISLFNVIYNNDNITALGIESDSNLHKLFDNNKNDITNQLSDEIIINKGFEIIYGTEIGDKIKLYINGDEYEKEVTAITNDYMGAKVYMARDELADIILDKQDESIKSNDFFTGVYSKDKLNKEDYALVINKQDVLEQTESMLGFIKIAVYGMIGSAIFIAVIVLYILTTMSVEDNYYSISLLKVMGYSKKEVNGMMLNSYLVYSIISYFISMIVTIGVVDYGVRWIASEFYMVMPFEFELWHGVAGLFVILIIFIIGSYAAKRKINKISLQEVLKSYSE